MAGEYLVDTNVFITAKNDFYAFDLTPGFWAKMKEQILKGRCCVIDAVDMEIRDGKEEELVQWWLEIRKTYPDIIKRAKEDEEVFFCYKGIAEMVYKDPVFAAREKARFLSRGDPWIIAAAKTWNMNLVTMEKMAGSGAKKVKIPDVCQRIGVTYMTPYDMMRNLGIKLF